MRLRKNALMPLEQAYDAGLLDVPQSDLARAVADRQLLGFVHATNNSINQCNCKIDCKTKWQCTSSVELERLDPLEAANEGDYVFAIRQLPHVDHTVRVSARQQSVGELQR